MKFKKPIISLIFICLFILLTGCSNKPVGMNSETYEYGQKALEIMDKYNSADISAEEAQERLDAIADHLDKIEVENSSSPNDEYYYHSMVKSYISIFTSCLDGYLKSTTDTYTVQEKLEKLMSED